MNRSEIEKLLSLLAVADESKLEEMLRKVFRLPIDTKREALYQTITREIGADATMIIMRRIDPARYDLVERVLRARQARELGQRHPLHGMFGGPQGPEGGTGANRWMIQKENDLKNSVQAKIATPLTAHRSAMFQTGQILKSTKSVT